VIFRLLHDLRERFGLLLDLRSDFLGCVTNRLGTGFGKSLLNVEIRERAAGTTRQTRAAVRKTMHA
jgi:hypothetical protein